jgi:hypothetical protein
MRILAKIWKRPDVVRAALALVVAIIVAVLESRLVG